MTYKRLQTTYRRRILKAIRAGRGDNQDFLPFHAIFPAFYDRNYHFIIIDLPQQIVSVLKIASLSESSGLTLSQTIKFWTFMSKFKEFADHKLNVAKMTTSLFDRVEKAVGKGENAGYWHFLLFGHSVSQSFLLKCR